MPKPNDLSKPPTDGGPGGRRADPFGRLMKIVRALEAARIHFTVTRYRSDAVSVLATVPGERWEIDVLETGEIEFERFASAGGVTGKSELKRAIAKFANLAPGGRD
jgi:hypothetical protein